MKTLVIAEKPSVAQDIVRALSSQTQSFSKHDEYFESDQYIITSAVGHLVEIEAPEAFDVKRGKWSFAHLPVIPTYFALKPVEKTKSRLNAVVRLAKRKDVKELINACDAGREGELIFRLIEQYAGGASPLGKPVKRLWLQSMTPTAIREGFTQLRSNEAMLPLADAARCRSESDWLVGINGTRAMTAFNSRDGGFFLTTVGRVQTPTLSLVVEREEHIRAFKARNYWEIHATFSVADGQYLGKWFNPKHQKNVDDAEQKADRIWSQEGANRIAQAVANQVAVVQDESRPSTQLSPLLFDLTSLQREANSKFGFSAKTTLGLAQTLYEKHKALTYPRTDSRYLPQDYVSVARDTLSMFASSHFTHLAPHARQSIEAGYVKPNKRVFDNAKVSDHFAIIPTLQAPKGLSDIEQKLYDLVAKRFLAVFFPAAEFLVTTRISQVLDQHFKTEGKVLIKAGWLAIYGKEGVTDELPAGKDDNSTTSQSLPTLLPDEKANVKDCAIKSLQTRPNPRYTEATLLSAMESAGKTVEDEELRLAMQEKGLGTPATRASIIEGLLNEKYMLREGRELAPTAKAFQLITLLRGLGVDELCKAELTGGWEFKLSQMEHGKLNRDAFMAEIADMTRRIVEKAKSYNKDSIPGNYANLSSPCPQCGGIVKENYRRFTCCGKDGQSDGCGFSFGKIPAGRAFELSEVEQFLRDKKLGPLDGFRSKAGWPFMAEIVLRFDEEAKNYKLEFDFGDSDTGVDADNPADFSTQASLGACPICTSKIFETDKQYVCECAVYTTDNKKPSCSFKSGKIILQQPVERMQMEKLLATGKTDLLEDFISTRTQRHFKAMLAWNPSSQKVEFAFENEGSTRKGAVKSSTKTPAKSAAKKTAVKKTTATKKTTAATPKKRASTAKHMMPSEALAAVVGAASLPRTEAIKKLWDYIKANHLQNPKNKREVLADDKLRAIFGKDSATMFEIPKLLGGHLA